MQDDLSTMSDANRRLHLRRRTRVYREWDYVTNRVTEYARHGSCNGCAECCRARITFAVVPPFFPGGRKAGGRSVDGAGIWTEVEVLHRWRHVFRLDKTAPGSPGCGSLEDHGNRCTKYDTRPWLCREWPISPRCVEAFPHCSFQFVLVGTWPIAEVAMVPELLNTVPPVVDPPAAEERRTCERT